MQKYLENAGVQFQFNTRVTNVLFDIEEQRRPQRRSSGTVNGMDTEIPLTEKDLVFVTNGAVPRAPFMVTRTMRRWRCGETYQRLLGTLEKHCKAA